MDEAVPAYLSYWEARKNYLYYQAVRVLATEVAEGARSVLDVGSSGCPYLEWFPAAEHRTSLDLRKPYEAPGVNSVTTNYLDWEVDRQYDLVLCLQVLEHVRKADEFAKKLLASGKIVIASVPYKWAEGSVSSHVHDPVDEAKMRRWFGREPSYSYVCTEVVSGARRLICVYDSMPKWRSLRERAVLEGKPRPQLRPKSPKQMAARERRRLKRKQRSLSLGARLRRLAKRILGRT